MAKRLRPSDARFAPLSAAARADAEYGLGAQPDWRAIDWREHLRTATILGRGVNYVDIGGGEGPPIVFVHGLGGRWANWLENVPRLAQERRAIALDLPGFGDSEMPAEDITISGFGRTVDALCEQLDLGPVVLVGNSMGGFTAAEVAIHFPARAERLVLVASAGIASNDVTREPAMTIARLMAATSGDVAARSKSTLTRPRWIQMAFGMIFRHPTLIKRDLLYEQALGAGKPGFLPSLEAIGDYDFRERLGEIGCPTLIIQGSDDMLVPVRDADLFQRAIPGSRAVVLADTGHVPMLERPHTFNRMLVEFLEEGPAETEARAPAQPSETAA